MTTGWGLAVQTINAMRAAGWKLDAEMRLVYEDGQRAEGPLDLAEVARFLGVLKAPSEGRREA